MGQVNTTHVNTTNVLVVGRLFEGLKEGLLESQWIPKGVPAFVQIVEGLADDPRVNLLTIVATKDPDRRFTRTRTLELPRVGVLKVLPWWAPSGGRIAGLDRAVTELAHLIVIIWLLMVWRAKVIYGTYAHVYTLALIARIRLTKTVLRVMGIFPHHRKLVEQPGFTGWCLRSPFDLVVCSEDGSDPGIVLPKLLNPDSKLIIRLNGCDAPRVNRAEDRSDHTSRVIFVGRLEPNKGCLEFVEAIRPIIASPELNIEIELIGDGSLRKALEKETADLASGRRFHMAGPLPHKEVLARLAKADIYVSGNWFGNLSNANLEAIAAGLAVVIPSADPGVPIDVTTEDILPPDVIERYDRNEPVTSLRAVLLKLLENQEMLETRQRATADLAEQLVTPWRDRTAMDIEQVLGICGVRGTEIGKRKEQMMGIPR